MSRDSGDHRSAEYVRWLQLCRHLGLPDTDATRLQLAAEARNYSLVRVITAAEIASLNVLLPSSDTPPAADLQEHPSQQQ